MCDSDNHVIAISQLAVSGVAENGHGWKLWEIAIVRSDVAL